MLIIANSSRMSSKWIKSSFGQYTLFPGATR
jgi:hypothetical protein